MGGLRERRVRLPRGGEASLGEALYIVLLCVWLAASVAMTTELTTIFPVGRVMSATTVLAFCCEVVLHHRTLREWALLAAVAALALNSYRVGATSLGFSLVMVYCAHGYDFRRLLKASLVVVTATVVATMALCAMGILPDILNVRTDGTVRHSLGFSYVTNLSHLYLFVVLAVVYLRRDRVGLPILLALLLADILIYEVTDSRNSYVLVLVVLVAWAYCRGEWRWRTVPAKVLLTWAAPVCMVVSWAFFLAVPYDSVAGQAMDTLLAKRALYTQKAFAKYGITAFGQAIDWSTRHLLGDGITVATGYYRADGWFFRYPYLYVDSSYLQILLQYGWVTLACVVAALMLTGRCLVRSKAWLLAGIMAVFCLHGLMDPQLMSLAYCPFLLCMTARVEGEEIKCEVDVSGTRPRHLAKRPDGAGE